MPALTRTTLGVLLLCALPLGASWAASVKLRYGFKPGAVYAVHEQHHDVGKSIVEMDIMGQRQSMESPIDHISEGHWSARGIGKGPGSSMRLAVEYGTQKGGDRWAASAGAGSEQHFGDSKAEATIDPVKGLTALTTTPVEPLLDLIYRARFAWLPPLPSGSIKPGDSFSHDYVMKNDNFTTKGSDEYTLDEISDGMAYFTVETRMVSVIRYGGGSAQGMGGPAMLGEMTLAYQGEGTAIFNLKEGIFIEREIKMGYATQKPSSGAFSSTMRGVSRTRWEMERR